MDSQLPNYSISNLSWNGVHFKLDLGESERLFLVAFNSLEIIAGTLSNFFVIVVFLLACEMRKRPSDLLILNLAAADFLLLTTFQSWLTSIISDNNIGKRFYFFYEGLNSFVQLASGHAVFLIALDRFLAVSEPLKYQTWVKRNTVCQSIAFIWTLAFVIGVLNVMAYELRFYSAWLVFWITYQLVILLLITLMYVVIFLCSYKQGKRIWRRESISETEKIRHRMMLKITMNTFILVCFFYATYLPVIIYVTHSSLVLKTENNLQMGARAWIYSFSAFNCCFNPVFYVFRTERFKQVCYRLLFSRNANNYNETVRIEI